MTENKAIGYGSRYRVVGTSISGGAKSFYCTSLKQVAKAEKLLKTHAFDGLRLEKFIPGIGYVLHE